MTVTTTPKSLAVAAAAAIARVSTTNSSSGVAPVAAAAMDLNSCRHAIERAAATKVSTKGTSLTIRQCLLEAGLSANQASNRTMQARVRRHVQRQQTNGNGGTSKKRSSVPAVPMEILIPITISMDVRYDLDDFDSWCAEVLDDDEISVLTDPACFLTFSNAAAAATPAASSTSASSNHRTTSVPLYPEGRSRPVGPPADPVAGVVSSSKQLPNISFRVTPELILIPGTQPQPTPPPLFCLAPIATPCLSR